MNQSETDILIIGAGVTGLAAGYKLKEKATLIEKDSRPGGLVKTHCFDNGYWFDHVLHILHVNDKILLEELKIILNNSLTSTPPNAWIETAEGIAKYPFQLNLGSLNHKAKLDSINDFAEICFNDKSNSEIKNYKDFLLTSFGKKMCEIFYFPYNEKMWKYPLDEIGTSGHLWNIHRPSFNDILEGAFNPDQDRETYNSNAFYPRPPKNSKVRGMELLSTGLLDGIKKLNLNTELVSIDPEKQIAVVKQNNELQEYHYSKTCLSTMPLPELMKICKGVPEELLNKVESLEFNKVLSIGLSIKGKRPDGIGHWRYYTDPNLPFTRLVFMTEFDPDAAPPEGFSLLVEITFRSKDNISPVQNIIESVVNSIKDLGIITDDMEILGKHSWVANPGYVVFKQGTQDIIDKCQNFLKDKNINSSGRYGNWEYSSMYKNITDGFNFAKSILG